jgi:phosphomannomutase / phosphoglucomutase
MKISNNIFRDYDIRGIYPEEINEDVAIHIGSAVGTHLKNKTGKSDCSVVVGRDTRASSPNLSESLIKGLVSTGCNVTNVGISLTPMIHFFTSTNDFDAGIEVTASHNPKQYNGFRLDFKDANPFTRYDIQALRELAEGEKYSSGDGKVSEEDMSEQYIKYLKKQFKFDKTVKVIVDCGYGTASLFAEKIFQSLGSDIETVFCTVDEDFPHGIPDPERKDFMENFQKAVIEKGADVGFAFDEDSDRFGVVDEKGRVYNNDEILLLFAKYLLKDFPGAKVISDVKSSSQVSRLVREWGGVSEMVRTGHTYFVEEMKNGAKLGGEFSGHIYFGDRYFGFDDGIYGACRALEILTNEKKPLSELMSEFPEKISTSEIKIPCSDNKKFQVVDEIKWKLIERKDEFIEVITIDGIRVHVTENDWFLIRASNTSPYLSVRAEAVEKDQFDLIISGVRSVLSEYNLDLSFLESDKLM